MSDNHERPEYCPTQGGSFTAYEPQWMHPADGWVPIPTTLITDGVPYPAATGGIMETIGLMGKAQALAIAYAFQAVGESEGRLNIHVRAQAYRVHYDIKAKKMDDDKEPMP